MNRKRILLCRNQADGLDSLLGLTTYYFSSADNIFVNLQMKQDRFVSEVAASGTIIARTKKRVHSAVKQTSKPRRRYRGYEATLRDIQREAQFSDVLVMQDTDYQLLCENTESVAYPLLLSCPVLVAPAGEDRVDQVILVDDGEPTTYQQIKHMTCLLPKLCLATPTTLLITHPRSRHASAQEEKLWIEYLKLHFAHLAVQRLDHHLTQMLPFMVDYTKNALVICPIGLLSTPLSEVLAPLKQFQLIQ